MPCLSNFRYTFWSLQWMERTLPLTELAPLESVDCAWATFDFSLFLRLPLASTFFGRRLLHGESVQLPVNTHTNRRSLSVQCISIILELVYCTFNIGDVTWGVSRWTVPAIRNFVRLLLYFILRLMMDCDVNSCCDVKKSSF